MQIVKQIGQECLLASMCMVADADYKVARKLITSYSWIDHMDRRSAAFFLVCDLICPPVSEFMKQWPTRGAPCDAITTPLPNEALDLSGRGILILFFDTWFITCAHAVAFEDYKIFDPATGKRLAWFPFAANYKHESGVLHLDEWHVCGIIHAGPTPKQNNA